MPWIKILSVFELRSYGILTISLLFAIACRAQNLVPNSGFEEVYQLKCGLNTPVNPPFENPKVWFESILKDWYLPTLMPSQLYSTLLNSNCLANPSYLFVKGYPKEGVNMLELELVIGYNNRFNGRSYAGIKLKERLVSGVFYQAGGYYSLANNYGAYASNNLGMLFTREQISTDTTLMLDYKPQINEWEINSNPLRWKRFGGCLKADGDEQYLTIGNFFSDIHTKVIQVLNGDTRGSDFASYFIDSVYVEKIMPLEIPNVITPNGDNSNETFVITGLIPGQWTFTVVNRFGKRIVQDPTYKNDWNGGNLSAGIYYYSLQNNKCPNVLYNGTLSIIH